MQYLFSLTIFTYHKKRQNGECVSSQVLVWFLLIEVDLNHGDIESVLLDGWVSQLIYELVAYSVTMKRKSKTPPVVVFLQRSDKCEERRRGVEIMTSFF